MGCPTTRQLDPLPSTWVPFELVHQNLMIPKSTGVRIGRENSTPKTGFEPSAYDRRLKLDGPAQLTIVGQCLQAEVGDRVEGPFLP